MRTVRAASACLFDRAGRVLMIARENEPLREVLAFPGGRLEAGETPEDAARRELEEETGHRVTAAPIARRAVAFERNDTRYEIESFAFTEWVHVGDGELAPVWLESSEALTRDLAPGMRETLVAFRDAYERSRAS